LPEYIVSIKIEKLDDGVYLATSDNLQGLVAQGRTIAETMEIAQDVARKLIESHIEYGDPLPEGIVLEEKIMKTSREFAVRHPMSVSDAVLSARAEEDDEL
jgi:predicted RNase H-like HicB family nuclease